MILNAQATPQCSGRFFGVGRDSVIEADGEELTRRLKGFTRHVRGEKPLTLRTRASLSSAEMAAQGRRVQLSCLHPGWQMAAVLPHPYPLPLGEGAGSPAFRQLERFLSAERGRQFSLSQRGRAVAGRARPEV